MIVCVRCGEEMRCTKTGIVVRWRGSYCKRGDRYSCDCGNEIVSVLSETEGYDDMTDSAVSCDEYLEMSD